MCGKLLSPWQLPRSLPVGGREVAIRWEFREVLAVMEALNDDRWPLFARWHKALRLFYKEPIVPGEQAAAMELLAEFITCGRAHTPGPRLMCWRQDAELIISAVNGVAGREVRGEQLHWWTFLSYFHAIGDSTFAQVVALREKLRTGKKLTEPEKQFYRQNRALVRLEDTPLVRQEKAHLEALLKGGTNENNH